MKPLVIIPHVSWRRLSLLQLLEKLSQQTTSVRVVVLHDDQDEAAGEHENIRLDRTTQRFLHKPVWWPRDLQGGVTATTKERAQCERWKLIEEIARHDTRGGDGVRILTLDDDMMIEEDYVARTLRQLDAIKTTDPVISWGGVDLEYRWRHYNESHPECELVLPQAGAMAFYADTFVGLGETRLAQMSHVRGGSEEVPVAAFLWNKNIPIVRPFGSGPQPHKLAYDPRSSYRTTQEFLQQILDWCIAVEVAEGCPRPPPPLSGYRTIGWPHAKAIKQLLVGKRPVAWVH